MGSGPPRTWESGAPAPGRSLENHLEQPLNPDAGALPGKSDLVVWGSGRWARRPGGRWDWGRCSPGTRPAQRRDGPLCVRAQNLRLARGRGESTWWWWMAGLLAP